MARREKSMEHVASRHVRVPLLAALATLAGLACGTLGWETGLPWTEAEFAVQRVEPRGPWLDVLLRGGGIERRFFTPRSAECESVLRAEGTVTVGQRGGYGPITRDGVECPVVGLGNLEDFRKSRSQGQGYGQSPITRGNDRIEIVYRDEAYLFARGGFSIAAMLGWAPGTDQVVALLPRTEDCEPVQEGGFVSTLFRQAGTPAIAISAGDGLCPVHGVIATTPGQFDAFREDSPPGS
jgi:hypothetical protein